MHVSDFFEKNTCMTAKMRMEKIQGWTERRFAHRNKQYIEKYSE